MSDVQLGYRRIGFLSIDPVVGEKTYGFATWALQGYADACTRPGLRPVTSMAEPTTESTAAAALRLFEPPRVSAMIAPQERSVIGVLKAAQARSIRIPRDLSLIGMLSVSSGELATPALTTIDLPADELGRVAARMLVEQLDGKHPTAEQVMLRPELVVRGTTARPRP